MSRKPLTDEDRDSLLRDVARQQRVVIQQLGTLAMAVHALTEEVKRMKEEPFDHEITPVGMDQLRALLKPDRGCQD
jgi:aminoglycoside N3'-acetyltransferase